MLDQVTGKGLLIHHWDTDGICSATLLLSYLNDKNITNKTPILGNFFLTQQEIKEYQSYDFIIIVDMSLPKENILALATHAQVYIFDHHLGPVIDEVFHYNPIIQGEDPNLNPSASWIVNTYLHNPVNVFALLGVIGDHEKRILHNELFMQIITDFCNENNLTFDELLTMVHLIDSNYKKGDRAEIELMPQYLMNLTNYSDILTHPIWTKNLKEINNEIAVQLKSASQQIHGLIYKKIHTSFSIISTITRQISWETKKDTIVVNTGFFADDDEIYVRSSKDLTPMIALGKSLGFKCGGKKEVLGSIVPKNKTDSFIEKIIAFLTKD